MRFSKLLLSLLTIPVVAPLVSAQPLDPALYQELHWRSIGPFRAGRTVAIAGIPSQPNVFYMAPNNGGVWKTTDAGRTWIPIFDDQPTGSIGALAVAPSNPDIIYVGSGEGLRRPDLSVGDGIYKSTDAGQTWQHLGLRDAQQISSIIVDPKDPNRLFVAALGHPYGPNAERGVFRSLDGGQTWKKVLYKDENTGAMDLVFDARNSHVIFASLWASRRPPWTTGGGYNGPGSGLYKSTDGGNTWRPLTRGLPGEADGIGRIGPAISPSDPNRMYAWVNTTKTNAKLGSGIYRSDDAGESWQQVNHEERVWSRGDDFGCVHVDPGNKDVVYVANTSTYKSTDAGQNFTAIKGAPGGDDYHTIWINPENPDIIALAVDQGATISVNGGKTWSSWYNQPTAQFYHVITDNQFPYWVYGGQQESGSVGTASRSDFGEITFRDWTTVGVEEYGYVAPDPLHPNLIYGGKVTVFDATTGQTRDVSPVVLRTGKYRFNRTAPLLFSPADPRVLYLGSNVLFSTRDGGITWQENSPDLTREDPGVPASLGPFVASDPAKGKHRGVIYSIAPSPKDAQTIWVGTDDGMIHVTRDGGQNWHDVTPPELTPWSKLAQMDASHFDNASAYAAVNRFRLDDLHPYIYRTHDSGKTWQKIVNGLPENEPVNTVREDPVRKKLLYAGTERSVYVSWDDGEHWQSLKLNLPPTSIRDLVIHRDDIVVGTHGRSFWILDNITPLRQLGGQWGAATAHLFAPQLTYRVRRNNNTDTPLPPEEPAGQNPPDGAMLDYWLKSDTSGPVVIEIVDADGKTVRSFSSADKPQPVNDKDFNVPMYWVRPARTLSTAAGMHRFVWDLTYPAPDVLSRDYPISAIVHDTPLYPLGAAALPGKYTVKLTADGKTYTQSLEIRMDPRVKTAAEDLHALFDLDRKIADALHRDYEAVQQIRSLRKQLKALPSGKASVQAASLEAKLAALEGDEGGYGTRFLSTPEGRTLARLNTGFSAVLSALDSADAAPTTQQTATIADLEKALNEQLSAWEQVKSKDIPEVNKQLKKSGAPELDLQKPIASSADTAQTTSRDLD
ncbi:MAG: glycoside hydrolase [Acidobacteriia bacterium]|nr:glycoside hydrolase [Terriglobia bacterium]